VAPSGRLHNKTGTGFKAACPFSLLARTFSGGWRRTGARAARSDLGFGSEHRLGCSETGPAWKKLELFFAFEIPSKSSHQLGAERAAFGLRVGVLEVLADFLQPLFRLLVSLKTLRFLQCGLERVER